MNHGVHGVMQRGGYLLRVLRGFFFVLYVKNVDEESSS